MEQVQTRNPFTAIIRTRDRHNDELERGVIKCTCGSTLTWEGHTLHRPECMIERRYSEIWEEEHLPRTKG